MMIVLIAEGYYQKVVIKITIVEGCNKKYI